MNPRLTQTRQFLASHLPRNAPGKVVGWLLAVCAMILASIWLTRLIAPRPVASLAETRVAGAPLSLEPIYRIFGVQSGAAPQTGNIVLTGVFSTPGGKGFATFRLPQGQVAALAGREVMPGVRLLRVEKNQVVLSTASGEQRLPLIKDTAAPGGAREKP
jgi:hypothetical protein